ncbi:MAG: histidine kinase [Bacteroidota bacterium]
MSENPEIFVLVGIACFAMLGLAIVLVVFSNRYQQKLLRQQIESKDQLIEQTLNAQEEERQRIASELHDEIGSKLNVIHLYTHQFLKDDPSEKLKEQVHELSSIINQTIQTTRNISHELLPPTLEEFGLVPALDELCTGFSSTGSMEVQLQQNEVPLNLPDKMAELHVFRIVQELITNSVKHGKASEIVIQVQAAQAKINYRDNGKGGASDVSQLKKGLGFRNIESRLKIIKGSWTFGLAPGEGFWADINLNRPV